MYFKVFIIYIILINLISVIATVYDKAASKKRKARRIKEKYLLFLGILGGSLVMYITMKLIHHKTHHKKFMKGLPTILTIQFILLLGILAVLS